MLHLVLWLWPLVALRPEPPPAGGSSSAAGTARAEALGLSLASSGRPAEAVAHLQQSVALNPSATSLVNLGLVWDQLELPVSAMECYIGALELDPFSAAAYEHMGELMGSQFGERVLAVEALQRAVAIDPARSSSWNVLGQRLHATGELDEAQEALERAAALRPSEAYIRRNLAQVLRSMGRWDEAVAALNAARAVESPPPSGELCVSLAASDVDQSLAFVPPLRPQPGRRGGGGGEASADGGRVVASVAASALPAGLGEAWRHVRVTRVATATECEWVVSRAEAQAASRGGWDGRGHHDTHRTNDIVAAESAELREWLVRKLDSTIWPAVARQFGVSAADLWLEDCFVVKYEADGQPGLGVHTDDSELSFNLLLSDPSTFEGGGTAFPDADGAEPGARNATVRPRQGDMLTHFGRLRHEGRPVSSGAPRYILAGFVRAKPLAESWRQLRLPARALPAHPDARANEYSE